jgi:hypothetical protein
MSDDRSNESNSLELPNWAVIDIHQEKHSSQPHAAAVLHSITEAIVESSRADPGPWAALDTIGIWRAIEKGG